MEKKSSLSQDRNSAPYCLSGVLQVPHRKAVLGLFSEADQCPRLFTLWVVQASFQGLLQGTGSVEHMAPNVFGG